MIQVKDAIENAFSFAKGVLDGPRAAELRLEEVAAPSGGLENVWLITLSMPQVNSFGFPASRREYKRFKVDGNSGEVIAMEIREIAHAE